MKMFRDGPPVGPSIIISFTLLHLFSFGYHSFSIHLLSKEMHTSFANTKDCLNKFEAGSEQQNERITKLEFQNKYQDEEIQSFIRKMSNAYPIKIDQMEEDNSDVSNRQRHQQQKRASRLIPVSLLINKRQDDDEADVIRRPPTSCNDLNNHFGYTLNGIYLVRKNNVTSNSKIDVVFCDFQPPGTQQQRTSQSAIEDRLGYLNVVSKSAISGVYFYVQRHGILPAAKDGVIRFNKERLNIGGAMNISTGVFTAPKAGIYHFAVTIAKEGYSLEAMWIYFRVNGIKMGQSAVGSTVTGAPATLHPTLKLKKGDRLDLWKDNSFGVLEYRSGEINQHFSGWLLADDDI